MNGNKKFFSKIGFSYLALGLAAIAFEIILFAMINVTRPDLMENINFTVLISALCNYILPFPIFYWLMKRLERTRIERESLGAKTFILYLGITFTLMWIGNVIGLITTSLLSSTIQTDIANPVTEMIGSTDIWLNLIIISLIAPIFEELLFRKMLIDRSIKYGARVSIILSALLFGLFHGNLNQFFYTTLIGGFFAYVYIRTGKVTYTIALHIFVNLMGSVVSLILTSSIMNLESSINVIDLAVVISYLVMFAVMLILGIIGLSRYKKAKFNGKKTEIAMEYPYTTMFMNPGMICFVVFFILQIAMQALALTA